MPKMTKKLANQVDASESSSYDPLPEAKYICALREVTVKEGKKAPYWSWEFEVGDTEEQADYKGRRLWTNTSTSEAALWKMKEVFDAFGVPATTDTDELIGEYVVLVVTQRVIESGSRAGEMGNNVEKVLPYDDAASGEVDGEGMFDDDDI